MKTKWAWLKVGVAIVVASVAFAAVYGCSGGKSGGEIQMPAEIPAGTAFGQPVTAPAVPAPTAPTVSPTPTPTPSVTHTLNIKIIGGTGKVKSVDGLISTTSDISQPYAGGATVTLGAGGLGGDAFREWSGDCTGSLDCILVMDGDHTVTARFEPTTPPTPVMHLLNIDITGTGLVKSEDGIISVTGDFSQPYAEGTSVTLRANGESGYGFTGWGGDCTGSGDCTLVMSADRTAKVLFEPITRILDIHISGMGVVTYVEGGIRTAADLSQSVAEGATVTLQAVGTAPSTFKRWEGDCTGSSDCNLVMDVNHTVTAVFETMRFMQITVTGPGKITIGAETIPSDTVRVLPFPPMTPPISVNLIADAGGNVFDGWDDDCTSFGTTLTCTITMDTDKNVSALFSSTVSPPTPTVPTVVSTSPANNENNVSLYKMLEATFNMPMEPTSVASAFKIKKSTDGADVAGTVSPSGAAVKFAPSAKLDPHTTYNGTITTAAKSVDGVALAADFSWLFTTVDWTWSKTFPVEFDSTYADMPDVAMDKKGNAAVVWRQAYGVSEGAIYLKIYKAGTVWERASDKILLAHGNAYNPRVAVNDNDIAPKAVVVWREYSSTEGKWRIYAERFDMKTGRADAEPVKIYDGVWEVKDMDLGLDDEGIATISWIRTRPDGRKDVSAVRTAATAPVPPLSVILLNGSLFVEDADSLQVAVNRAGDAIVVWRGQNGTGPATVSRIGCNYYTKSYSRWAEPGYLDTSSPASFPNAIIDQAGNIMVAWHQAESGVYHIKAKRKVAGSSEWREERTIESATSESAMVPRMAADISGNVIIAWVQGPVSDLYHMSVYANRYDSVSRSFGEAVNIGVADRGADFPYVISDESGNGAVVWLQHYIDEGVEKIFSKRYLVGKGWNTDAQEIASAPLSDSFNGLRVSGSAVGDGIAVWSQRTGTIVFDVNASRFQLPQVIMGPAVTPAVKIPASGVRIPSF